ncbi:hypothetical protein [Nonomuraea maritima]|uniref:hypothetical protein n=1 Tax=Nonomuraea maritima TaxID=683260 RepID=UPI00371EF816
MQTILRRTAGVLAGAAVLTAPAPATAETPYAQASALISPYGYLENGENVVRTWRVDEGEYCVALDHSVNLEETQAIHATVVGEYRTARVLSVHLGAPRCEDWRGGGDVIGVQSRDVFNHGRDTAFYLTVS